MVGRKFLQHKVAELIGRGRGLNRMDHKSVGIRPQDRPYAPSPAHFEAANRRLAKIDKEVERRLTDLNATWQTAPPERVLTDIALVERELDRARRSSSSSRCLASAARSSPRRSRLMIRWRWTATPRCDRPPRASSAARS